MKGEATLPGGHEDKWNGDKKKKEQERNVDFGSEEILRFFKEKLKGKNPMLAIVPTASTIPEEMAGEYLETFRKLGIKELAVLDIRSRADALDRAYLDVVEKAAAVFFTGGNQLRLSSIFGGTPVLELMRERYTYDDGFLIAGTSAGATAMSTPMIYEAETHGAFLKGDVRITTGLEFMKNVAIDTHFIERGRIVRMAQCVVINPGCIGIGLEEDTAVYVTEGKEMEVVGSGLMTVVDGMRLESTDIYKIKTGEPFSVRDIRIHFLASDQKYTIPTYEMLHA